MTSIQIFSLAWLFFVFALSLWRHANLGLVAIPAAFVLALIAGIPMKQLYAGFPTQLVFLILGVMYLWNHVQESGGADIFVRKAVALAGGRTYLLPWVMCFITAAICAVGALPAAALAITTPVAMAIAKRERIPPTLMGVVNVQGICIGGFSPLNPWANLVMGQMAKSGLPVMLGWILAIQVFMTVGVGLVAFFCFGGKELLRRPAAAREPRNQTTPARLTAYQWASMAALFAFIGIVLFKFDIGLTAFVFGVALQLAFGVESKKVIAKLPWGIMLMVAGILLYVSLLENLGVLHAIGTLLTGMEKPSLIRFSVSLFGTVIANFESSSIAVLALVMPVALKSMGSATAVLTANLHVALLYGSIVVMTASPFHIGGALIMAEVDDSERVYKNLLIWVACLVVVLPFFAFLL